MSHPIRLLPARLRLLPLLAALIGLAGCVNLAPDYQRPAAPVPATWSAAAASAPAEALQPLAWREFITDARLREVVALALDNNRDLRVAAQNIERARALYRVQRADLFPQVTAEAGATRQRSSKQGGVSNQYSADVGFSSYELDFFGRIRNLNAAALASFQATAENHRSAQISLVAEISTAWLTLAADAERLQLARDTLDSQQRSLALSQRMHALGALSGLALAQSQTAVESARLDVAGYSAQIELDRNALRLLAGADIDESLLPSAPLASASALLPVPAGLSSQVLLQRPDVLAAERTLQAANADIGVARAAFFPRIALTAAGGTASDSLSGLFKGANRVWSFGPSVSVPLFTAGANQAQLDAARAQFQADVASYEKSVQVAFREVADALAQRGGIEAQLGPQQALLDATQKSYDLATALFKNGASAYLEVLDAQRSLYAVQQSGIGLRLAEQSNRVTLYKVLGGGWE